MKKIIALALAAVLTTTLPLAAKTPKKTSVSTQSTTTQPQTSKQKKTTSSSGKTAKNSQPKHEFKEFDFDCAGATFHADSPTTCTFVRLPNSYFASQPESDRGEYEIPVHVSYKGNTYTVTKIGPNAFSGCESLSAISIPPSITVIGRDAFRKCHSLTSVTLPNTIKSIESYAFSQSGLETITIPESVSYIGFDAFYVCESLKTVTLNCNLTKLKGTPFTGCRNLEAFYGHYASPDHRCAIYNGILFGFAPAGLTSYTFPSTITEFSSRVLMFCRKLKHVTLPDSLTKIGREAFMYCESLESITIPVSVTSIGKQAFSFCDRLRDVNILNPNTTIE